MVILIDGHSGGLSLIQAPGQGKGNHPRARRAVSAENRLVSIGMRWLFCDIVNVCKMFGS